MGIAKAGAEEAVARERGSSLAWTFGSGGACRARARCHVCTPGVSGVKMQWLPRRQASAVAAVVEQVFGAGVHVLALNPVEAVVVPVTTTAPTAVTVRHSPVAAHFPLSACID